MPHVNRGRGTIQQDHGGQARVRLDEYSRILRAKDGNYLYVGRATSYDADPAEAVWQIIRFEFLAGVVIDQKWANDSEDYGFIWNNRSTYFSPTSPSLTSSEFRQPVTVEASTPLGAPADSAATTDTGAWSLIALFKRFLTLLRPRTATLTNITGSAVSQLVFADNANRKGFILVNEGNRDAYVAFAATASLTAYTVPLPAGAFYVQPLPMYTGPVSIIWTAAGSTLRATEY